MPDVRSAWFHDGRRDIWLYPTGESVSLHRNMRKNEIWKGFVKDAGDQLFCSSMSLESSACLSTNLLAAHSW